MSSKANKASPENPTFGTTFFLCILEEPLKNTAFPRIAFFGTPVPTRVVGGGWDARQHSSLRNATRGHNPIWLKFMRRA